MKVYKIGMAGFGFMGKTHTYCYSNMPLFYPNADWRISLNGLCVTQYDRAQQLAEQHGYRKAFVDFDQMVQDPDIDIINICTPNHLHFDQLIKALRAGKHIYCEKPLTVTAHEADQVAAEADKAGVTAQVVHHLRFFPATLRAKQLIEDGALGRIISFRCCYLHSRNVYTSQPLGWKQTHSGAGVLRDLGSHALDMMYWLIGEYESVQGVKQTAFPVRRLADGNEQHVTTDEAAYMIAKMKCGAVGTVEASKIATGSNDDFSFEIHGDKGAVKFNLMQPNYLLFFDATKDSGMYGGDRGYTRIECVARYGDDCPFPSASSDIGWLRGHQHSLYSFLQCVHQGVQASPSIADGAYIVKIMQNI